MNKKLLAAAIAVASAAVSTSALAATTLGSPSQKGSLLIFPRVEALNDGDIANAALASSDTLINITNDSSQPVNLQCYWGTTDGADFNEAGGNAALDAVNPDAKKARHDIRNNHYMSFTFVATKNQPVAFWAGDLSNLASTAIGAGIANLTTTYNAPQFNFFQDGSQSNAGELRCWAVNANGDKEVHHNHLSGTATIYTFAPTNNAYAGQASEYNAWSFQAKYWADPKKAYEPNSIQYTGKELPTPGKISLDGAEYDQCPSVLLGSFIPTKHKLGIIAGLGATRTQVSMSNCHADLRQDSAAYITKLTYSVWDATETKRGGAHECMGMWYESSLGDAFPLFTYKSLKGDSAYFRAQPTTSALCNDTTLAGASQKGAAQADIEVSSIVGVQVNDIETSFQTSTNLVGLGGGATYGTTAGKGEILWDPSSQELGKK